jgi:hypothetical protein
VSGKLGYIDHSGRYAIALQFVAGADFEDGIARQFAFAEPMRQGTDKMAAVMKPLAYYMEEAGISVAQLVKITGLDAKLVAAIVTGNYTPSPSHRERLSAALGVSKDDISWGHAVLVHHLRGNGPQTGRAT